MAGLDYAHAAQDESAHEELAELGIVLHDTSQLFRIDQQNGAGVAHANAHQGSGAAQGAHLAGKIPRAQNEEQLAVDGGLSGDRRREHLETSGGYDEHATR